MYRMTPKQLILLSILSALFAGSLVAVYDRYWRVAEPAAGASVKTSDSSPRITPPSPLSTDEENNIQVYEAVSPGVVNITSTSYEQDFWGMDVYPQQGTG